MKNLHEVALRSPLTPAIAKEAEIVNWHVSNGEMETNASSVAGLGSGEYAMADIILCCFLVAGYSMLAGCVTILYRTQEHRSDITWCRASLLRDISDRAWAWLHDRFNLRAFELPRATSIV